jgi:glycosyltransferase involved in cell wall biosynthesis
MTAPLVSIVMPTCNRLHFLRPAIESVIAQTFPDWELIVADDGSATATKAYLATLLHLPQVRVIDLPHSGNPAKVRNAAIEAARGKYLAFLDSDDVWLPTKLEAQVQLLEVAPPGFRWSYTLFELIDAAGYPLLERTKQWPLVDGDILESLLRMEAIIALPSVMVERELLGHVAGFDEQQLSCEDYDLWLRLAAASPVLLLRQRLVQVRRHREHTVGDVQTFEGWRRALSKARESPACRHLRPLLDAQCARVAAGHARSCAAAADRLGTWRVVAASMPRAWRYRTWWSGAALALAQASAPRGVWDAVRGWRRRRRDEPRGIAAR